MTPRVAADLMVRGHSHIQVERGTPTMIRSYRTHRRDDRGASAVEYGLLIAGIATIIVATVFLFGGFVRGVFTNTCVTIHSKASAGSTC